MNEALLELLCAPLSHAALRVASSDELRRINSRIQQRLVRNRDGATLEAELDGALVCASDGSCYPVRDALPVLIAGEAFDWPQHS
jgi:uncharacterized protein YbaR (Trm112 family)